jgi:hypothetical protein
VLGPQPRSSWEKCGCMCKGECDGKSHVDGGEAATELHKSTVEGGPVEGGVRHISHLNAWCHVLSRCVV